MSDLFDPVRIARDTAAKCERECRKALSRMHTRAYRKWHREWVKANAKVMQLEAQS